MFLLPNGVIDNSVTGIATFLSELFDFDISFILLIVSFLFLILACLADMKEFNLSF